MVQSNTAWAVSLQRKLYRRRVGAVSYFLKNKKYKKFWYFLDSIGVRR